MMGQITEFRLYRLARQYGRRVTVDDDGCEGFELGNGVRFISPAAVPDELLEAVDR